MSSKKARAGTLLATVGVVCLASGLLSAPASAKAFPCEQFDAYVDKARVLIDRKFREPSADAGNRALTQVETKVDAQSCAEFRYGKVHQWLRREWTSLIERRDRAQGENRPYPRIAGRIAGLDFGISFVEQAAKDQGVFLRPIRKAGDE